MSSKQTVTFSLTAAQAKRWAKVLQSKEGVKALTSSLVELEQLKKSFGNFEPISEEK